MDIILQTCSSSYSIKVISERSFFFNQEGVILFYLSVSLVKSKWPFEA